MDARLAESFFQPARRPPTVLGRRLRPFCLWHSFMLSAFSDEASPSVYATLSLAAWQRVALVLGLHLDLKLGRDTLEEPRDAGHLAMQELLLRAGHAIGLTRRF